MTTDQPTALITTVLHVNRGWTLSIRTSQLPDGRDFSGGIYPTEADGGSGFYQSEAMARDIAKRQKAKLEALGYDVTMRERTVHL